MTSARYNQTLDLVSNNDICEAVGCFKKATIDIEVKVGQGKRITLNLCKDCVNKYRDQFADDPPLEIGQLREDRPCRQRDNSAEHSPFVVRNNLTGRRK
jgi:hypothetical protein